MANATAKKRVTEVTLNLSEEEAATLQAILNRIGGCPKNSLRKHSDSILEAIQTTDIRHYKDGFGYAGTDLFQPNNKNGPEPALHFKNVTAYLVDKNVEIPF